MKIQQEKNEDRIVFPGEQVQITDAKYNHNAFFEQNGKAISLYFGITKIHNVNQSKYLDLKKQVTTYIPQKNNFVIGIIKNKIGQNYVIDINAPNDGRLQGLQFDGATKRNKPNLNIGDIVYARVAEYNKFLGSTLSCINQGYSTKNVLGQLKGGMIVYGLRGRQKNLQQKLQIIKKYCTFEVAFGKNDILWFNCSSIDNEVILYNIFEQLLKGCNNQVFQNLVGLIKK